MYQNVPISPRVQEIRALYRSKKPKIDISRYRIVTEFYMNNPQLPGILKRGRVMRELFEKMPTPVRDHELIVGHPGVEYRSSALYPEHSFYWFFDEIDTFPTRGTDPYDLDPEDRAYIEATGHFWDKNSTCAAIDDIYPDEYREQVMGNGVLNFLPVNNCQHPIGHYCGNFWTVVDRGLGSVLEEVRARKAAMLGKGLQGTEGRTFQFYRAEELVIEGLIIYTRRYADECLRQAETCADEKRKAELLDMADRLNRVIEKPCESYHDALQACFLYQLGLLLESQPHGISYGRLDQYCGKYLERDLAEGRLTRAQAQELTDMFILKVAEINKVWSERATKSGPGYTAGQLITLGGVDRDGNDVTNDVTYMVLQSSARLKLHNPPLALRVHAGTPDELWEAGIETTKQVGGVPCFEWDDVTIEALRRRGIALEDARNYCLIGCVEPCVCGCDFANSGGDGNNAYTILPAALWCAINNGANPFSFGPQKNTKATGPQCGYLYEMESMEEVLAACIQENISVPEEFAVMGIDNNEEICENTKPTLSSICPDFENAGFQCGELLDLQLHNPSCRGETRTFGIIGVVKRKSTTILRRTDRKVTEAVEFIRLHASEGIGVDDVVAQMGCSRRTAEMRFCNLTGRTIQTEIRDARMSKAISLLRNPRQAIGGIAHLCGYESDSTLRYAFKAKTGLSMREWRERNVLDR